MAVADVHISLEQFDEPFINEMVSAFAYHEMIYGEMGKPVDYIFLKVNRAFCEVTGLVAEEIVGKRVKEVVPKVEDYWIEMYGEVASTGNSIRFEHYSNNFDAYYDVKAYSPVKGYFATIFNDVTKFKQIEKELAKQKNFIERVMNTAPIVTYIYDIDKQENVYISGKSEQILGYKRETIQDYGNQVFEKLIDPDDLEKVRIHQQAILEIDDNDEREVEYRLRKANGDWSVFRSMDSVFQRDESGKVTQIAGVMVDITREKEQETRLEILKNIAEKANYAKTEFLASISHDIRTPLNVILGLSEIMQDKYYSKASDEDERKYFTMIKSSCQHVLSIINNVLNVSKIEHGVYDLQFENIDIHNQLKELCNIFSFHSQNVGTTIDLSIDADVPQYISIDQTCFNQILFNLLSNSIKFTVGGTISISVKLHEENQLSLEVKDSGIGIPQEKIDKIFRKYQTSNDGFVNKEGTGLGLAIVDRLVKVMGGDTFVESIENVGSRFVIKLPFSKATEVIETKVHDFANIPQKMILLVDDSAENRLLIKLFLQKTECKIIEAGNGISGIDLLNQYGNQIDLILLDIQMPLMDGYETIKHIKKDMQFAAIPVVALTAYAFHEDIDNCKECGFTDHLAKPITRTKLFAMLEKVSKVSKVEKVVEV